MVCGSRWVYLAENSNAFLYLFHFGFRDKQTFEVFKVDFKEFVDWLMMKYPEDADLKEHANLFEEKYKHLPEDVFWKEIRRATSVTSKRDEIKKIIFSAFSSERRVTGEYQVYISSEQACVKSYNELDILIRSDKRNILLNSARQGQVLKHMKTTMRNKGSIIKCLCDKEILISLSHCNFFIAFYELTEKYPQILQCALEFFTMNFKIVKEVAPEVFAQQIKSPVVHLSSIYLSKHYSSISISMINLVQSSSVKQILTA